MNDAKFLHAQFDFNVVALISITIKFYVFCPTLSEVTLVVLCSTFKRCQPPK